MSETETLDAATREALGALLLSVADDEFVIGFWDSEWTGIAPMLEEDVATSSMAQDELGHAAALYGLLAELTGDDPDRIAFGRAPDAYRHAALLNHARGDWAFTVARRWLYETADAVRLGALARTSWQPLADLAAKMRREETYHRMHIDTWLDRLAGSTPDVRARLIEALARLWPDAHTIFAPIPGEETLLRAGILPEAMGELRTAWASQASEALVRRGIEVEPVEEVAPDGRLRRTHDFAWLHGEFTLVVRSEVGATW
jgi:ring-1,2-phenylacetyl-CoA epoxidase subunit PaaC